MPTLIKSPQYRTEYHVMCAVLGHIRTFRSRKLAYFFAGSEHRVVPVHINLLADAEPAPF